MIDTILGILMIICLADVIIVISVGAVWFCLWMFKMTKELWQEIREAQEEE